MSTLSDFKKAMKKYALQDSPYKLAVPEISLMSDMTNAPSKINVSGASVTQPYSSPSRWAQQVSEDGGDVEPPKKSIKNPNISEARDIIDKILQTDIVPFLWSAPGIGKSTLVTDICKKNNWDLIDLRLSLLNPVDLRGLPIINRKQEVVDWYHPSFLPNGKNKRPGVLFLDEINLAPLSVQAAAYQLILDKKVGEYSFPAHWKIIAAGNRITDHANVYKISAPLANRFIHLDIKADFNCWRVWATNGGNIKTEIIDFLTFRPSLLLQMPRNGERAFPSPRSWKFLSDLINLFPSTKEEDVTYHMKQIISGTIGDGTGGEFIAFLEDRKLRAIPEQVKKFIATGKITLPNTISIRYALISAIHDNYKNKKVKTKDYKNFLKKLSAEERGMIERYDDIKKTENEEATTTSKIISLDEDIGPGSVTAKVKGVGYLKSSNGLLVLKEPTTQGHEIIAYEIINFERIKFSFRDSGLARSWPKGTIIREL